MNPQEYRGLKSEIIELSKLRTQLAVIFFGLMVTVVGYIYGSSKPPDVLGCDKLVLGASVVFLILGFFIERLRLHLRRLTAYICVYFEEGGRSGEYQFESSWRKFRGVQNPWSYTAPIALLMCASLALGIAALWLRKGNSVNAWKVASLAVSVWGAYFLWSSVIFKQKSQRTELNLIRSWEEIRKDDGEKARQLS